MLAEMRAATVDETLAPEAWSGIRHEWLWIYRGKAPKVVGWSGEIVVPAGVFFVQSGSVGIRTGSEEITVPSGHAFFSAPGVRRQWIGEDTLLLSVGFRSTWPDGSPLWKSGLDTAIPTHRLGPLHRATQRLFRTVHPQQRQLSFREASSPSNRSLSEWSVHEAAFRSWFAAYAETLQSLGIAPEARLSSANRLVQRLRRWLDAQPLDRAFVSAKTPANLGLGPRRISQLLHEHLGTSARAYVERRRLNAARDALFQRDTALKEIAFSLGFRHASHFTAWFKSATGMSPSAFRESLGTSIA